MDTLRKGMTSRVILFINLVTELYTVLNFNNYYLGDDGKIIGQHVEIY